MNRITLSCPAISPKTGCHLAVLVVIAFALGGCVGPGRKAWNSKDLQVVEDVRTGKRTTASAAWWGCEEEDHTAALQAAIRSGARRVIVPNIGRPWVIEPIQLESNQEIVFEKGVVIEARPGKFRGPEDSLFTARDKENIVLRGKGASWVMRKQDYRKAVKVTL